jgi:hypothetical protein
VRFLRDDETSSSPFSSFLRGSFLSFISSPFVQPVNEAHKQRLALVRRSATGEGAEKRPTAGEVEGSLCPHGFCFLFEKVDLNEAITTRLALDSVSS